MFSLCERILSVRKREFISFDGRRTADLGLTAMAVVDLQHLVKRKVARPNGTKSPAFIPRD